MTNSNIKILCPNILLLTKTHKEGIDDRKNMTCRWSNVMLSPTKTLNQLDMFIEHLMQSTHVIAALCIRVMLNNSTRLLLQINSCWASPLSLFATLIRGLAYGLLEPNDCDPLATTLVAFYGRVMTHTMVEWSVQAYLSPIEIIHIQIGHLGWFLTNFHINLISI